MNRAVHTVAFRIAAALPVLLALTAIDGNRAAQAAELTITVNGVNADDGRIYVALHQARDDVTFPDPAGAVAGAWRRAREGRFSITFTGLEAGRYAVNGFHDANGNEDLDTNLVGLPVEGYGFGNGVTGRFGPPSFNAASVMLQDKAVIELSIRY